MRNFIVTVDGKSYSVGVEELGEDGTVVAAPASAAKAAAPAAQAAAPAAAPAQEKAAPADGTKVLSPFPGMIKNLLVAEGTKVKKDQAIVVLEAMKMDNDITAPCEGVVTFAVTKGANVETNTLIATIS
ncbi:MAG: biotin/lipoyl-binding protein [Clostridia bacterium]|nr:biotin/lipoyl-binding protein [Clostridia bacterium]